MKRNTKPVRRNGMISFISMLFLLTVLGAADAFNPQPEPPGSVMVGASVFQTVRLSVYQPPQPIQPPETAQPPQPIRVWLVLFDSAGTRLEAKTISLLPGQGHFVDFDDVSGAVLAAPRLQSCKSHFFKGGLVELMEPFEYKLKKKCKCVFKLGGLYLRQNQKIQGVVRAPCPNR